MKGLPASLLVLVMAQAGQPSLPIAVRNERPRPTKASEEVLVLRNQELARGAHEQYYRASREGVWPWYEKIGTRVVGQWIVLPSAGTSGEVDDAYRLARYASFEHWRATRDAENAALGGNGPNREKNVQAGRDRAGVQKGSKGAYFLQGFMAPDAPFYMPGVAESYERIDTGNRPSVSDELIAVRNDVAQPGQEIVELRYQRIAKNRFDAFVAATRDSVWPWEEKLGVRPIGQWKVIYPNAQNRTRESPEYDEVITLTRYASRAHRDAMGLETAVFMGGNGPDYQAWRSALRTQESLTRQTTSEIMQGYMYHSPPIYMPGLPERYRRR
jgi:hypothetical protein